MLWGKAAKSSTKYAFRKVSPATTLPMKRKNMAELPPQHIQEWLTGFPSIFLIYSSDTLWFSWSHSDISHVGANETFSPDVPSRGIYLPAWVSRRRGLLSPESWHQGVLSLSFLPLWERDTHLGWQMISGDQKKWPWETPAGHCGQKRKLNAHYLAVPLHPLVAVLMKLWN